MYVPMIGAIPSPKPTAAMMKERLVFEIETSLYRSKSSRTTAVLGRSHVAHWNSKKTTATTTAK
jgi:hypothetical protein